MGRRSEALTAAAPRKYLRKLSLQCLCAGHPGRDESIVSGAWRGAWRRRMMGLAVDVKTEVIRGIGSIADRAVMGIV